MYLSGLFWMFLTMYQVMWPLYTKLGYFGSICHVLTQFDQHFPGQFVQNVLTTCFTMYWAWEIKNTWLVHCEYMVKIQYFLKTFKMFQVSSMYWPCVFNFPSSVYCKHVVSIFWTNWSGKCWLNWVGTWQMDSKYPKLVYSGHMTWYIVRNIQNKLLKYVWITF